ncbi:MAG: MFS transporter [Acidobacteria bacterium]|nr:MFS transporter [Acidobacteriota bacterium]
MKKETVPTSESWLNKTTLGIGLTSLFSDWSHEIATAVLPAFLISLGAGAAWLGLIEGLADGLSSVTKLIAGHYTDRLHRRKPLILAGYAVTTVATGTLALATGTTHVLISRATAWLGRGARTPGRKALLAAAVPAGAYGRAFGLERLMDTAGAIAGPLSAFWLLRHYQGRYAPVFVWTLLPGLLAVVCFAIFVREQPSRLLIKRPFWTSLRSLPPRFRRFLFAVGIFGAGDFAHTLLIFYATQMLAPELGTVAAAGVAMGFYVLHNVFYASFAFVAGWLGDRVFRPRVLAAGYALAGLTALLLVMGVRTPLLLGAVFILGGIYVGTEEALEDSLAAELVPHSQHGVAFGTLAAVNAVGDFISSLAVGWLWSAYSPGIAFGVAGLLFFIGAVLVLRVR